MPGFSQSYVGQKVFGSRRTWRKGEIMIKIHCMIFLKGKSTNKYEKKI